MPGHVSNLLLVNIGGYHVVEQHVEPGAGTVGAAHVGYFNDAKEAIEACREIDAQYLLRGAQ